MPQPVATGSGRAQALAFLHRVFADDDLRQQLREQPLGLEDLVKLGQTFGLVFAPADLQTVYRQEFTLRWAISNATAERSGKAD